jgi:hypothetical protein
MRLITSTKSIRRVVYIGLWTTNFVVHQLKAPPSEVYPIMTPVQSQLSPQSVIQPPTLPKQKKHFRIRPSTSVTAPCPEDMAISRQSFQRSEFECVEPATEAIAITNQVRTNVAGDNIKKGENEPLSGPGARGKQMLEPKK